MKLFLFYSLSISLIISAITHAELVGYWKFDGDFTDSSGNGNDGELFGG
ncbi:MAG: hypothetical protein GWP42_07315, partial [Verrucomicrobiales bacterium]|nr:hypothetical protein [Verrucomicrobiales bacterium]